MKRIPGLKDVRIAQLLDYPTIRVNVDRVKALELGVDQRTVAANLLIGLATNVLIQPTYWLDLSNGVNYSVLEQVPQHLLRLDGLARQYAADAVDAGRGRQPAAALERRDATPGRRTGGGQPLQRAARDRR